jgi:hypothetical protein
MREFDAWVKSGERSNPVIVRGDDLDKFTRFASVDTSKLVFFFQERRELIPEAVEFFNNIPLSQYAFDIGDGFNAYFCHAHDAVQFKLKFL